MRYLSGKLFHQNKFSVKSIGPSLFFPWLLVFYYLTDALILVLFTSSTSHPHPLCRGSRSQMFFKFYRKTQVLSCEICDIFKNAFSYRTPPAAASIYFAFHECFFFYFSLGARPLLPYSTVTFFVWWNTFVFISLLLHHYYHNIAEWFIRIAANVTTYCIAIFMIIIRTISALIEFMLKQKNMTYE